MATRAAMPSKTLDEHIESTPDTAGGKPRIRGRRITVQDVAIWHEPLGKSADEIAVTTVEPAAFALMEAESRFDVPYER